LQVRLTGVLRDLFSELVFSQHVRFALVRFDGEVQRLRFTLGDEGIVPTVEVGSRLGAHPFRMADRLRPYLDLLCDLGILTRDADGRLTASPNGLS
jgi:hypothetical protein